MATLPRYDLPQQEFVSVREYLTTSYEPDCDYVDGKLEERNLGEHDHAFLQSIFAHIFMTNRKEWGVVAATDWRVQVKPTRFRVPDLTVLPTGSSKDPILTHPPQLVIEILSPEDRLNAMVRRCEEYLQFGVGHVWIIDPMDRRAYRLTSGGLQVVGNGELTISGTAIRIVLSDVFAELDAV